MQNMPTTVPAALIAAGPRDNRSTVCLSLTPAACRMDGVKYLRQQNNKKQDGDSILWVCPMQCACPNDAHDAHDSVDTGELLQCLKTQTWTIHTSSTNLAHAMKKLRYRKLRTQFISVHYYSLFPTQIYLCAAVSIQTSA